VENGVHILLADTADEFAAAVVSLLHSAELRVELGSHAQMLVGERHDWQAIIPAVESVYDLES
jgi:glycosyltransferase involved in cell wall biosynthesis